MEEWVLCGGRQEAKVGKPIKKLGIECDLRDVETVDVFTDSVKWEATLEALGARREILDGNIDQASSMECEGDERKFAHSRGSGSYFLPAYALSPYKFVCALRFASTTG